LSITGTLKDATSISDSLTLTENTTYNDILTWLNTDEGTAAADEVQTVTITGTPTGGTFTLSFGTETTAAIAYNATASTIDDALEDLTGIPAAGVTVTTTVALPGGAATITFNGGTVADTDVAILVFNSSLTGGASPEGTIVETTKGGTIGVLGYPATRTATASITAGALVIQDTTGGYSKLDVDLSYSAGGTETWTMPGYFETTTIGGEEVQNFSISVYDTAGGKHTLSGGFTRTDTANKWDMILASVTGDIYEITMANRRVNGITFESTGEFSDIDGSVDPEFIITFDHDITTAQTIGFNIGTKGKFDGLTQFKGGDSTAQAIEQDGYAYGVLSSVTIDGTGKIVGSFSNGEKKDVATIQLATFQNTAGMESVGGGYYSQSANSGEPQFTLGLSGGAGRVLGGSLEKSNAEVAEQFIEMINAQNGYQANARSIKIANELLKTLNQLI